MAIVTTIPEVFAPIHAIATRAANANFQLRDKVTDEVIYDNKKWNKLNDQPNFRQSMRKLVYMMVFYKYACGNRYLFVRVPDLIKRSFDGIVSLQLLPPQDTEPHIKPDRPKIWYATSMQEVVDYYQVTSTNDGDNISSDQVYFDPFLEFGVNSINPVKGTTPLIAAEKPLSNLVGVYAARNVIYFKRGALGFIVSKKQDESGSVALTPEEKKDVRDQLQEDYGIVGRNKDIVGVTDADIDFVRIAMSIEELQPFEETAADAAAIYAILGVPGSFMPSKDNPTFNNVQSDERKLYVDVAIGEGDEIAKIFTTALMVDIEGFYIHADYTHIQALQEDKKTTADVDDVVMKTAFTKYEKNFITKNQALVMMGLEEIGPEGDKFANEIKNDPWASKNEVGKLVAITGLLVSGLPPVTIKNQLLVVYGFSEEEAKLLTEGLKERTNESTAPKNPGATQAVPAI